MDKITIKIDDSQVISALERLAAKTNNLRPLMNNISQIMLDDVEENFSQQGRPRWQALAPTTIARREKQGHWPGAILQVRGELAGSISARATNASAIVGTNKVYAAIHQFGGMAGRNHSVEIPARPYLQISSPALEDILDAINNYLNNR